MSSSDSKTDESDAIIYEDSSESEVEGTINTFKGSTSYCAKCLNVFKGKEKELAIECDMPYCRRWYHQGCINIDLMGMSDERIVQTESISEFC